jgi:hypothetical protein
MMTRTSHDSRTFSVEEWDELAKEGETYAPWFRAMAALQDAVDQHLVEAQDGFTCLEQVQQMRPRIAAALDRLEEVAQELGVFG